VAAGVGLTINQWAGVAAIAAVAVTTGFKVFFMWLDNKRKERESDAAIEADRAKAESHRRRSTDD